MVGEAAAPSVNASDVTVVAATALEAKAVRRALPGVRVIEGGIALAKMTNPDFSHADVLISCGLAGGLQSDLPTGTVVIPREVLRPDGSVLQCDGKLTDRLVAAVRSIGVEPVIAPMVTTAKLVTKSERMQWAKRGYAAVDMETGLLNASRIAAVRVVLDTPSQELSQDWLSPMKAIVKPWNWPQLVWLSRHAPRCCALAARVVAAALA